MVSPVGGSFLDAREVVALGGFEILLVTCVLSLGGMASKPMGNELPSLLLPAFDAFLVEAHVCGALFGFKPGAMSLNRERIVGSS